MWLSESRGGQTRRQHIPAAGLSQPASKGSQPLRGRDRERKNSRLNIAWPWGALRGPAAGGPATHTEVCVYIAYICALISCSLNPPAAPHRDDRCTVISNTEPPFHLTRRKKFPSARPWHSSHFMKKTPASHLSDPSPKLFFFFLLLLL